jgi:hypothetical protein
MFGRTKKARQYDGPVPIILAPGTGPYFAELAVAADGVLVTLWDVNSRIGVVLLNAPLHVIADRLWVFLIRVNRDE